MEREDVIDFLERLRQTRAKAAKPREERPDASETRRQPPLPAVQEIRSGRKSWPRR